MPSDFFFTSLERRRAREQDHEIRVLDARDPDLLAVDDVAVALLHRGRPDLGRVGAGGRLGDAHRLQAQLAARDLRQVFLLLRLGAVPQQRAHVVHLAVAGAGVAAAAVDLLHDDRRLGEPEAGAAVVLRDQRREPACLRQRVDEFLGIAARLVDAPEILGGKFRAERADRVADLGMRLGGIRHGSGSRKGMVSGSVRGRRRQAGCGEVRRAGFIGIVRERRLRDVMMTETLAPFGANAMLPPSSDAISGVGRICRAMQDIGLRLRAVRTADAVNRFRNR